MTQKPQHQKSGYEKWQDTIDKSKNNGDWDEYDEFIISTVDEFNQRLGGTPGYRRLDWTLVKAMVWTESGPPDSDEWTRRPIQIGNPGDPGLHALLFEDRGSVILTPSMKAELQKGVNTPKANIQAGIAYVLMRAVNISYKSVTDPRDVAVRNVEVASGDSLDIIARRNGTTVDTLKSMNGGIAGIVKPKQKLVYVKASIQPVITGWHKIDPHFVAKHYNTRDSRYEDKLNYCLKLIGD
jgi:hypothetical protein